MADRSTTLCTCVLPESSIEDIQGFGEERSPLRLGLPNDPRLPHRSPANHNDRHAAPIYGPTGSDNSVGRYSYGLYNYGPTGSDNALGRYIVMAYIVMARLAVITHWVKWQRHSLPDPSTFLWPTHIMSCPTDGF